MPFDETIASKVEMSASTSVQAQAGTPAAALPDQGGLRRKSPARRDSKAKFERIVEATIKLLDDHALSDLSISMIAEAADLPRTSIYDFFPTVFAVFEEVARRHVTHSWSWIREEMARRKPVNLREAIDASVDAAVLYFNSNPAARKTLLGSGPLELHVIDQEYDTLAARLFRGFVEPNWPIEPYSNQDPFRTLSQLQTAIYAMSARRHGMITQAHAEECKLMSHAYLEAMTKRFVASRGPRKRAE